MRRQMIYLIIGVVLGGLIVIGSFFIQPYRLHGSQIEPPAAAPEIRLPDQTGQIFQLSSQTNKVVLIYFGYTSCPDVCPATLSIFRQIETELGTQAAMIQPLFVTVDPERDTPARLAQYLNAFSAHLVGISGAESELAPIWQEYGIARQIRPTDKPGVYFVDHTSRIYLVDLKGRLRLTYPFGVTAADVVQDIRFLLKENPND
jgi:protein SCO1/2